MGIKVTPLRKIGAGFVLTALSFVIVAIIQGWIDAGQVPNISWQILAFVVLTAGEVLISITGLEYAYTQAPPSMKSTIMACWLITVTLGNVLVSVIQTNISNGGFFRSVPRCGLFLAFHRHLRSYRSTVYTGFSLIKERSYINR
jgi:POT family proton-dependent oligopeptide transporter